jgi:ribonuclease-3
MTDLKIDDRLTEIEKIFSIKINDKNIIRQSLIHKSWAVENKSSLFNERLEFLGDSVLSLIVTTFLYKKYPQKKEGELSKLKSVLVSKPQLAKWAKELNLGRLVYTSSAEESSGGKNKESILANLFEAILGAVYLDQGIEPCTKFIEENFLNKEIKPEFQDYKSILQEIVQRKYKVLPVYEIVKESGPDHDKIFESVVKIGDKILGKGKGKTKKQAEQSCAKVALKKLGKN